MKTRILKIILFISILIFPFITNAQTDAIIGKWFTEENKSIVEIVKKGGKYYGKIIWLKEPIDEETGKAKLDKHNENTTLSKRPIIGIEVMTNFDYIGENKWENGTIYDPKGGDTYSCNIELEDKNTLKVRGYIGISIIGRTDHWKRKQF